MLLGYIDDSQSEVGEESFYLAGYVMDAESWAGFISDWDDALSESPSITHLHMCKANPLKGQFSGFSARERNAKLFKLACVIDKYKPLSVEASMSKKHFIEATKGRVPYNLRTPYFSCFYGILTTLCKYVGIVKPDEKLSVVFDDQGGLGLSTLRFYEMVKESHRGLYDVMAGTPTFANDKDVSPLQAADMLAWFLRRNNEGRDETLYSLPSLLSQHIKWAMPHDEILKLSEQMAAVPHVQTTINKADWKHYKKTMESDLDSGRWRRFSPPPQPIKERIKSIIRFFCSKLFGNRDKS